MNTTNPTKLLLIGSQHLDVAWLWNRIPQGEELQRMVFELALDLTDKYPDAGFVMSRSTACSSSRFEPSPRFGSVLHETKMLHIGQNENCQRRISPAAQGIRIMTDEGRHQKRITVVGNRANCS